MRLSASLSFWSFERIASGFGPRSVYRIDCEERLAGVIPTSKLKANDELLSLPEEIMRQLV